MGVKTVIDGIIDREGAFGDNKADLGGATKYGITEKTARLNGYTGPMSDLPRQTAYDIYLKTYWLEPRFNEVAKLSEAVANELCDTAVNQGVGTACPMLQRALNLLNKGQKDFPDLTVDGSLGPASMMALAKFLAKRGAAGEKVLLKVLNVLQGMRYIEITEKNPSQREFFYGWIANRVEI